MIVGARSLGAAKLDGSYCRILSLKGGWTRQRRSTGLKADRLDGGDCRILCLKGGWPWRRRSTKLKADWLDNGGLPELKAFSAQLSRELWLQDLCVELVSPTPFIGL